jgi:hypothetical protein
MPANQQARKEHTRKANADLSDCAADKRSSEEKAGSLDHFVKAKVDETSVLERLAVLMTFFDGRFIPFYNRASGSCLPGVATTEE